MSGDYEHAARLHRDGLHIAEQLGLWPDAADRLASLGSVAMLTGDHDAARDLHERAMRLAAGHHHKPAEIHAAVGLALGARREGRLDEAEERMRLVLDWETRMDFGPGIALALAELGFIAEQRGDAEAALRLHADGWNAAQRTGDVRAMALALEGLAGAHVLAGDHARAAKLLGAAHAARDSVKVPLPEAERADVDRITDAARKGLGENAFREAYGRGTSQSPVEARAA
jgi:tetratricopeptide (TPR) repeat protein